MRTIFHVILLGVGFLGGIYVGVHYKDHAAAIDQARADQSARIAPQVQAAVARAKIELIDRLQSHQPAPQQEQVLKQELDREHQNLDQAQIELDKK